MFIPFTKSTISYKISKPGIYCLCLSILLVFKFNLINVKKGFKMFPLMDIKVTSLVFHVQTAIFHQTILNKEKFTTFCNEHFFSFSLNIPAVNQFLINYTLWFFFIIIQRIKVYTELLLLPFKVIQFSCFTCKKFMLISC